MLNSIWIFAEAQETNMSEEKRLDRIEDKIDKVLEKASNTDVTLAKQSVILEEHVRRTEALEAIVMPIKTKVDVATLALKVIAGSGVLGGVHGIMHYFMKLY